MSESICKDCERLIKLSYDYGGKLIRCTFQVPDTHCVTECSHFKQKRKPYPSELESDNQTQTDIDCGDEPRYCDCGKKLGKNKELGRCNECIKKFKEAMPNRTVYDDIKH